MLAALSQSPCFAAKPRPMFLALAPIVGCSWQVLGRTSSRVVLVPEASPISFGMSPMSPGVNQIRL